MGGIDKVAISFSGTIQFIFEKYGIRIMKNMDRK